MTIERKIFAAEIKAHDKENLIVEHFISTETPDRGGDIVRASGMRVKGKPVVLLGHGRGSMGSEPIAKPLSIVREKYKGIPGIMARTQFFPDDTGKRLFEKTIGGFMPNWSIGFIPIKSMDIDGGMGRDIKEWDLLEYSLVGVPMNPEAQTMKGAEGDKETEKIDFAIVEPATAPPDAVTDQACVTCGKMLWEHSIVNDENVIVKEKVYCKETGCEIVCKTPDPPAPDPAHPFVVDGEGKAMTPEARMAAMESQIKACQTMCDDMMAICKKMEGAMQAMTDAMKSFTSALPAPPAPGKSADGTDNDNPPEPDAVVPRLVIVRDDVKPETEVQKEKVIQTVRAVVTEHVNDAIARMRGKVK